MGTHTNRQTAWTAAIRSALAQASITPRQISMLGVVFALPGALVLLFAANVPGLLFAAACVAMLWLCGLFDAPVAEQPHPPFTIAARLLADALLVLALGYAAGLPWLGWLGAALLVWLAHLQRQTSPHDHGTLQRHAQWRQGGLALLAAAFVTAALERIGIGSFWTLPLTSAAVTLALAFALASVSGLSLRRASH